MNPKFQLWICDIFQADIEAALRAESIDDVELTAFPAHCGHPPTDWPTLSLALPEGIVPENICIMGGACVANLASQSTGKLNRCKVVRKCICFEYLLGSQMVNSQIQNGAYLISSGWLKNWRQHLDTLGFTQETGRDFFKESIKKLVLLDTGTMPDSVDELQKLAAFLDLPFESLPVGLDLLRLELRNIVEQWRHYREMNRLKEFSNRVGRLASDFAIASDLLGELVEVADEEDAVRKIAGICRSLFAPAQLKCVGFVREAVSYAETIPSSPPLPSDFFQEIEKKSGDFGNNHNETGFWLKLIYRQTMIGWLEVDGFAFPEHRKHYLNLALAMSKVFALCIHNARTYARLEDMVDELQQEIVERRQLTQDKEILIGQLQDTLAKIKTLQGLLPICAGCKKIRDADGKWNSVEAYVQARTEARFSHGMCPECIEKWFPGLKK